MRYDTDEFTMRQFDFLASLIEAGGKVCHEVETAGGGSMCGVHKHRWPCPNQWTVSRQDLVNALRQLRTEYEDALSDNGPVADAADSSVR